MELVKIKCYRCCTHVYASCIRYIYNVTPSNTMIEYQVCGKCYHEWHNNDHHDMWLTLYRANSRELADKFMLDFLGKLG